MPHMPLAVCVPCGREYRVKKNGYEVLMLAGTRPYYQVSSDMWVCPSCGHEICLGFGTVPHWQNYMSEKSDLPYDLKARFAGDD